MFASWHKSTLTHGRPGRSCNLGQGSRRIRFRDSVISQPALQDAMLDSIKHGELMMRFSRFRRWRFGSQPAPKRSFARSGGCRRSYRAFAAPVEDQQPAAAALLNRLGHGEFSGKRCIYVGKSWSIGRIKESNLLMRGASIARHKISGHPYVEIAMSRQL